ncbi:hypothetical protein F5887DRAFT_962889 [Amanita rubescens]|nr:hypothetical protein F5887DRAFT_962889 [Amanita rubescens]
MNLCEITPELQLEVLQFCTPLDLAALSRAHTSLRDVAQHALYSHIFFLAYLSDFIQDWDSERNPSKLNKAGSLFHTLSTSARKAAMVNKLRIHFSNRDSWNGAKIALDPIMVHVSDTLKKLPNLVDLRIAYDWFGDFSGGCLSETIRGGHFQLHTLWLGDAHDLEGILANQPNLRFLGVFYNSAEHLSARIKLLVQRASSSCTIPTIVILNYFYSGLQIFPSSHRPGQVFGECREITRSLYEFPKKFHVFGLTFNFLWSSTGEDIGLFSEVMKGIATCFQTYYPRLKVGDLRIVIHDLTTQSWNFPQFAKSLPLPLFETVKDVVFQFLDLKEDRLRFFIADAHLLVRELGKEWSLVQHVRMIVPRSIRLRVVRL